ncbi:MAG: DUF1499 domain-containing protein [Burkholderiales bacterium]
MASGVRRYARAALAILAALGLAAGIAVSAGLLAGKPPPDLGLRSAGGQTLLKAPSPSPNSVSSQADLPLYASHPQRDYARIAPLRYKGDGPAALQRLAQVLEKMERTKLTQRSPSYLRAESSTAWMGFTDDLEFWLDEPASVIHLRSGSRLGRKDFGANRERVERIRALFSQAV